MKEKPGTGIWARVTTAGLFLALTTGALCFHYWREKQALRASEEETRTNTTATVDDSLRMKQTVNRNTCRANLRMLENAKQQWALENRRAELANPTDADMLPYLFRGMPVCPEGGRYVLGAVIDEPQCTVPTHSLR